jgi:3-oxoacyl-[acyl-carrier protein] reductase
MSNARAGCAVVTGGSRGIGAAVAVRLRSDGWPVAVIHRGGGSSAERLPDGCLEVLADIRDGAALAGAFAEIRDQLGPPLVLINNAGVRHRPELAAVLDAAAVSESFEVNLTGTFEATKLALRTMMRARWGRIVNISSVAGLVGSPGLAAYAAAKAGLISYTRTVAVEVATRGVTVNAVAPGLIETDMTSEVDERLGAAVPARRRGTPAEVAACVGFLVSEDAGYVTGATITVDGGLSAGIDPSRPHGGTK